MITLKDILNNKRFTDLKLINENADLNRDVATIESTETPDIASYLTPNTFLLTTAMVYKDNQDELCKLIVDLNRLPTAALGIKLGRFVDKLDPKVIETANRLNFPLIQIPTDTTLGSIFHQLLSYIWSVQNEELLYSLNIQKRFSNLMIKNASLNVLIKNLSSTLKKTIALVDPFGNIINSTNHKKSGYSKRILRDLVEELSHKGRSNSVIEVKINNKDNKESIVNIYPINTTNYYPYYLIVFDAEDMPYPMSMMAIEQATLILAFTLYKNLRVAYSTLTSQEEFLKELISPKTYERLNEDQLLFKGEKYGLKLTDKYLVINASIENKDKFMNNMPLMEEGYILIYNWLKDKLSRDIPSSILFPDRENYHFIILVQDYHINLLDRLSSYRNILQKTLNLDICFFMGNLVQDIASIKDSFNESIEAIKYGEIRDGVDFIKYHKKLETFELLNLIPKNQMRNFNIDNLQVLLKPEDETMRDLRDTLKVFLDLNCNITDTAKHLFIHRNTVKYRIQRCKEILGEDILDPKNTLKLRISLAYLLRDV